MFFFSLDFKKNDFSKFLFCNCKLAWKKRLMCNTCNACGHKSASLNLKQIGEKNMRHLDDDVSAAALAVAKGSLKI